MSEPDGNTTELQALLDRAARGDPRAYDDLIAQAAARLLRLTRRMLANYPRLRRWEETDDVFQNAVLRLHRALAEVRPESVRDFLGLAALQIRRTLLDLARHHFGPHGDAAHYETAGPSDGEDGPTRRHDPPAPGAGPQTLEAWAEFHGAVERLPPAEREVFELLWYGGMLQQDAACVLGVSLPTVKRRFRSARLLLYEALHGVSPLDAEERNHA